MSLEEVSKTVESIKKFSDADVVLFVKIAVEQGLTFDADYLRLILKDMQNF